MLRVEVDALCCISDTGKCLCGRQFVVAVDTEACVGGQVTGVGSSALSTEPHFVSNYARVLFV